MMRARRSVSVVGLMLAAAALRLTACSAVDPVPPNPHILPDPLTAHHEEPDASDDAPDTDAGADMEADAGP